jgi:hypothetical protein
MEVETEKGSNWTDEYGRKNTRKTWLQKGEIFT